MLPILVGLETEYGFTVEGHGAEEQIDDAMALVRGYPGECHVGWDYRFESPRADLRGFKVDHLSYDPEDAKFDSGQTRPGDRELRSDRVLPNGARFYNDHGHPEYATPECWSVEELALHDLAGDYVVMDAARAFERVTGKAVSLFKNNTDGHGASYGTHESYLAPRAWGLERLYSAVCPILVARQLVCGAGKVGAETGNHCDFQISQRADFFTEPFSVDTLFRRPVFNTRDEPHADPSQWVRLHVICGDANRIGQAVQRKVAFVKLAIWLEEVGRAPLWRLRDVVGAFKAVSRDLTGEGRIELEAGSWTTSRHVLESYVESGERFLDSSNGFVCEALSHGREALEVLDDRAAGGDRFERTVDWAAKLKMIQQFLDAEGTGWDEPGLKSYDLAYHRLEPEESLYAALDELGLVEPALPEELARKKLSSATEGTRALARSVALRKFCDSLVDISWGVLGFETPQGHRNVPLRPDVVYPNDIEDVRTLDEFVARMEELA